uniref:Uncharacterized protein n=1 Tax=Compsopogon caeruleus TaxID=31354 RepID=A0A7S1XEI6_9RHOD
MGIAYAGARIARREYNQGDQGPVTVGNTNTKTGTSENDSTRVDVIGRANASRATFPESRQPSFLVRMPSPGANTSHSYSDETLPRLPSVKAEAGGKPPLAEARHSTLSDLNGPFQFGRRSSLPEPPTWPAHPTTVPVQAGVDFTDDDSLDDNGESDDAYLTLSAPPVIRAPHTFDDDSSDDEGDRQSIGSLDSLRRSRTVAWEDQQQKLSKIDL